MRCRRKRLVGKIHQIIQTSRKARHEYCTAFSHIEDFPRISGVWVRPELTPKSRPVRLALCGITDPGLRRRLTLEIVCWEQTVWEMS